MENDEIRAKPRRSMEDLNAFISTGTSSWYASSDHPSIVKSHPPPTPHPRKKGQIVPLQIGDRYPIKSTNVVSRGCVATEAGRPRIQRFTWQFILALDVNDLGDLAFSVCQANKMNSCVHIPFLLLTSLFAPQSYATQVCCNWKNSYWFGLSANKSLTWLMKCSGMWPHSKLGNYKVMSGLYPANSSAAVKSRSGYFYSLVEAET